MKDKVKQGDVGCESVKIFIGVNMYTFLTQSVYGCFIFFLLLLFGRNYVVYDFLFYFLLLYGRSLVMWNKILFINKKKVQKFMVYLILKIS